MKHNTFYWLCSKCHSMNLVQGDAFICSHCCLNHNHLDVVFEDAPVPFVPYFPMIFSGGVK